jgi:hypothetical protein
MIELAKQMWGAYAIQAGGKTFDGKPLPNWDELGEDRQACWAAAAKVSADRIEELTNLCEKLRLSNWHLLETLSKIAVLSHPWKR